MATKHAHISKVYSGKTLHIITTHANNICMKNLNGKQSLIDSSYYGINGGFFDSAALNIAMSDGQVIGDLNNSWCDGCVITWNGAYLKKYQPIQNLAELDDDVLTQSGTWAQGGHAMRLGARSWLELLYSDVGITDPDGTNLKNDIVESSRYRTGLVVDSVTKSTHLITCDTPCSFAGFRTAIQTFLDIVTTDNENTRYYGLFLDGGGSTQMKYRDRSNTTFAIDKSGQNRKLFQIIALRDST